MRLIKRDYFDRILRQHVKAGLIFVYLHELQENKI